MFRIRIRIGMLLGLAAVVAGCSSSRKMVVQDGYRGITQASPDYEPKRPGALSMAPESKASP